MAPIQQIGSRLVRTFTNGKTIITETLGKGQTLTKVLDKEGRLVMKRLKTVSQPMNVGGRKVVHTDRILSDGGEIRKIAVDRVYNNIGERSVFVGSRELNIGANNMITRKIIDLPITGGKNCHNYAVTWYDSVTGYRKAEERFFDAAIKKRQSSRNMRMHNDLETIGRNFNSKGLQIPDKMLDLQKSDCSMVNMRRHMQENYPARAYTNWPGMGLLDETVPGRTDLLDFMS